MKTITINERTFELIQPRNAINPYIGFLGSRSDIYQWYDSPSQYKVEIWEDWLEWAYTTDGLLSFEITSANTFQFSIGGVYVDDNNVRYGLRITRGHNRAYLVK